jgi:nucleotide-binding universal stress UspA family protein
MKTILVPTDFSEASKNALLYAAEMAIHIQAKLILLNVYDNSLVAVPTIQTASLTPGPEEIEGITKLELEKAKRKIESKFGAELVTEIEFKWGFTVEEINKYAKENKVDFIVMGMHEADYFTERFLGSTPTMTLRNSTQPVLIVHEKMRFMPWRKIVLAVDGTEMQFEPMLTSLKKLVRLFHAELHILSVSAVTPGNPQEDRKHLVDLEYALEDTEHSLHFRTGNDVPVEINHFVKEIEAQVLVMIPHKHSLLVGILTEATTKKMAFHSQVPVLSLHE